MKSLVYIEPSEQGIDSTTKNIALKIGKLSNGLRGPLIGIAIGNHLKGKEEELKGLLDELIVVEPSPGSESNTEVISNVLTSVMEENSPGILFLGFTHQGMEVGAVVGWRLAVPVITNCVGFHWDNGYARVTRAIQGGKYLAAATINLERGAVISVQKGAWKEEETPSAVKDSISMKHLSWNPSWAAEKTEVLRIVEEDLEGEDDITKAEILVSVGRGLGGPENLPIMKELANKLGGMISCSRPVSDLGWLPVSRQVGISGRTVSPVIYMALGISGQANHLAGVSPTGVIIAVNKDPSAPIFNVAKYGIVEDVLQFVPELLEQIKQKS